jgi:hypothetical protein
MFSVVGTDQRSVGAADWIYNAVMTFLYNLIRYHYFMRQILIAIFSVGLFIVLTDPTCPTAHTCSGRAVGSNKL